MLTLEKITAAAQALPVEFSLGQLVDQLIAAENQPSDKKRMLPLLAAASLVKDTPQPIPAAIKALRGIAAGLPPADMQKSAKDWEAERIQEKYGV